MNRLTLTNTLDTGLSLILAVVLAGCIAVPIEVSNILPPDHVPFVSGQTGIVISSTTSPPNEYRQWQEWSRYDLRSTSDPAVTARLWSGSDDVYGRLAMPFAYRRYPDDKGCAEEPGLESECGRLFALEQPEGDYEIWQVSVQVDSSAGVWTVALPDYRLTVEAGTVRYIGNLDSRLCIGSFAGSNVIIAVDGAVFDEHARDMPLLTARCPFLADYPIEQAAIRADPWQRRRWRKREPPYGWGVCDRSALAQDNAAAGSISPNADSASSARSLRAR